MQKYLPVITVALAAFLSAFVCGCGEPEKKIAPQAGGGKARFVPGAVDYHMGLVKYFQPNGKDYTPLQKHRCYREAIPLLLKAYKAMSDYGRPEHEKRLTALVFVYRDLAVVEGELGNARGSLAAFGKALRWCDALESYWHGKQASKYYRGYIYYLMKDYEKAEKELIADIEIRPSTPEKKNILLLEEVKFRLERERYRVRPGKHPPDKDVEPPK